MGLLTIPRNRASRALLLDHEPALKPSLARHLVEVDLRFQLCLIHLSGFLLRLRIELAFVLLNRFLFVFPLLLAPKLLRQPGELAVQTDEVVEGALLCDAAAGYRVDIVALREEVQGMGDENDGLSARLEAADDRICEKGLSNMCVNCKCVLSCVEAFSG